VWAANTAAPKVSVKQVTASGLKQEIARRKGKVVLLNLWATWCPPCVASYPDLVKISRKYASQGLDVLSVSVDDPAALNTKVVPFLKKQNPGFATFIKAPKNDEEFIRAVDPKWYGDLPADVLFSAEGKRIATLTGEPNMTKLEQLVKDQLAQRTASLKRASR